MFPVRVMPKERAGNSVSTVQVWKKQGVGNVKQRKWWTWFCVNHKIISALLEYPRHIGGVADRLPSSQYAVHSRRFEESAFVN